MAHMACHAALVRVAQPDTPHQMTSYMAWPITKAGFLATKEPTGLARSDGRRPDGVTLIPWEDGKCLAWDATVIDTMA